MLLYTANIGGYDKLQVTPQPGFDFHIYQTPIKRFNNVKLARKYKIEFPHYWDWDIAIWLDANIKIHCDLNVFVDKWLKPDIDLVLMEHGRDCIYDEMDACIERKKDTKANIERQRQFYQKQGYPKHQGMSGTGIMIKRHSQKVGMLMERWFGIVYKFSHRDQLAFNYALWKSRNDLDIKLAYIPYSVFGNEFELIPHEKNDIKIFN